MATDSSPARSALLLALALAALALAACADREDPLVIAHRGLPGAFPDNTVAGFMAAADEGADTFETDLWLTADGEVVLAHDGGLGCFTQACTGAIHDQPAETVRACLLPTASDGGRHTIASLEEALIATRGRYTAHFLEIKTRDPAMLDATAEAALRLVDRLGTPDVVWHTFDPAGVVAIRAAAERLGLPAPVVGLQLFLDTGVSLEAGCPPVSAPATEADVARLAPDWVLYGGAFIDRLDVLAAHGAGRKVATWGGDSPLLIRRALDLGVDGVFTDTPGYLRRLLDE